MIVIGFCGAVSGVKIFFFETKNMFSIIFLKCHI